MLNLADKLLFGSDWQNAPIAHDLAIADKLLLGRVNRNSGEKKR